MPPFWCLWCLCYRLRPCASPPRPGAQSRCAHDLSGALDLLRVVVQSRTDEAIRERAAEAAEPSEVLNSGAGVGAGAGAGPAGAVGEGGGAAGASGDASGTVRAELVKAGPILPSSKMDLLLMMGLKKYDDGTARRRQQQAQQQVSTAKATATAAAGVVGVTPSGTAPAGGGGGD